MLAVLVVSWPIETLLLESVKPGAYTPRERVVVVVMEPDVPVMVRGYWPGTAVPLAVNVRVLDEL